MKILKSITVAGLLAAGVSGLASAANPIEYVHIAGAPAYRQDAIKAINYFVANLPAGSGTAGETGAYNKVALPGGGAVDPNNSPEEQWYIVNYQGSGTDLVISLALTGSAAGVESVGAGSQQVVEGTSTLTLEQNFIPDADSTASLIGSPNNTGTMTFKNTEPHVPDFTLSDTFQATTPYNGQVTLNQGSSGQYYNIWNFTSPLTSEKLAIEPYVWVGSPGLAARGVTNITTAQAQKLFTTGRVPLNFFTGNASDQSTYVYGLTRDPGSGSRLVAFAETGVGVTTSVHTYAPTITGASADALGDYVGGTFSTTGSNGGGTIAQAPAEVVPSTQVYDGNTGDAGYASFGTADGTGLIAAITSSQTNLGTAAQPTAYFITYLNPTDAAEAVQYGGASVLTYNGVAYASGTNAAVTASDLLNLQQGKYTFWSFEQIQYNPSSISSLALGVLNSLAADWPSVTLATGVQLTGVPVTRSIDGGTITGP